MVSQTLPQPAQTVSHDCRDVIFASSSHAPSSNCRSHTLKSEAELLCFGSVTLSESLRRWQDIRSHCQPASENPRALITQEAADDVIHCLQAIIPKAERKPILPDLRPRDWFKTGDRIISRVVESEYNYYLSRHEYKLDNWTWFATIPAHRGVVTESGNGRVSLQLDSVPCFGHDLEYIGFCPFVLHEWEHTYFRSNLSFFSFWRSFCHNDSYADLDALILG